MKRDFLEGLGLDKETVDKIMVENGADLEREKAKTTAAKADLAAAQAQIADRDKDLETLKATAGDAEANKKALEELQGKYSTETAQLKAQIADRDYADAITRAITGKGLKFSSKAAERDFISSVNEKKLELKDGELVGMDDFIKAQREADPEAFAPEKAPPRFISGGDGGGHGAPGGSKTVAEMMAESIGKAGAARDKAANTIISNYKGGTT